MNISPCQERICGNIWRCHRSRTWASSKSVGQVEGAGSRRRKLRRPPSSHPRGGEPPSGRGQGPVGLPSVVPGSMTTSLAEHPVTQNTNVNTFWNTSVDEKLYCLVPCYVQPLQSGAYPILGTVPCQPYTAALQYSLFYLNKAAENHRFSCL